MPAALGVRDAVVVAGLSVRACQELGAAAALRGAPRRPTEVLPETPARGPQNRARHQHVHMPTCSH